MNFIEQLKAGGVYPGYPSIEERATGLVGLYDHPSFLDGIEKGRAMWDDGTRTVFRHVEIAPSFRGEFERDQNGRPLHPYYKEILEAGLGVWGPGAYWKYGPNKCADPVMLGVSEDGYLKVVVIERGDTGVVALPGGFCDIGEDPRLTALRELREETRAVICTENIAFVREVWEDIVADARTTLNAWAETTGVLMALKSGTIDTLRLSGGDDARRAFCAVVDTSFYEMLAPMHEGIVRAAVEEFEEFYEVLVCQDGWVHTCQD